MLCSGCLEILNTFNLECMICKAECDRAMEHAPGAWSFGSQVLLPPAVYWGKFPTTRSLVPGCCLASFHTWHRCREEERVSGPGAHASRHLEVRIKCLCTSGGGCHSHWVAMPWGLWSTPNPDTGAYVCICVWHVYMA